MSIVMLGTGIIWDNIPFQKKILGGFLFASLLRVNGYPYSDPKPPSCSVLFLRLAVTRIQTSKWSMLFRVRPWNIYVNMSSKKPTHSFQINHLNPGKHWKKLWSLTKTKQKTRNCYPYQKTENKKLLSLITIHFLAQISSSTSETKLVSLKTSQLQSLTGQVVVFVGVVVGCWLICDIRKCIEFQDPQGVRQGKVTYPTL